MGTRLIPRALTKIVPTSRGLLQTSVTGIGATAVFTAIDNLVGAPAQRFGVVIPVVGVRISIIDAIVYGIHAGGFPGKRGRIKNGLIAVGASKFIAGTLSVTGLSALGSNVAKLGGVGTAGSASGNIGGGL